MTHSFINKMRFADLAEKVILVGLLFWLILRMTPGLQNDNGLVNGLYVLDQALVLAFCLFRRPATRISFVLWDWVLAFGASFLPLMVVPASGAPLIPLQAAAALLFLGMALHLSAKLTLRRSFGVVAASRGIKVSGPYRLVRHPMYAGYFLTEVAILLAGPNLFNMCIILATWVLQVLRVQAEERFYADDPDYAALCRQTKYRILPGIF